MQSEYVYLVDNYKLLTGEFCLIALYNYDYSMLSSFVIEYIYVYVLIDLVR